MVHVKPHVTISLLGRFKNEIGESYHLMPVLSTTPRGLEPRKWTQRVLGEYAKQNIYSGYMFWNPDSTKLKSKNMEPRFFERLIKLQSTQSDLIEQELDVMEEYGVSRSFCRGGTSEATNQGAPPQVIELNGRWRKSNQSGASRPNVSICEHYMDIRCEHTAHKRSSRISTRSLEEEPRTVPSARTWPLRT
jgi:hypothetical protein